MADFSNSLSAYPYMTASVYHNKRSIFSDNTLLQGFMGLDVTCKFFTAEFCCGGFLAHTVNSEDSPPSESSTPRKVPFGLLNVDGLVVAMCGLLADKC
jgi:hypothetical protein